MLLETKGLSKHFGSLVANDSVDFAVPKGEVRGIIGPNGAGKSTFFNAISGFYSLTSGMVTFDEENVTDWKPAEIAQKGLVRTFQIASPLTNMTAKDNLLAAYTPGIRITESKRERADEILDLLEMEHQTDKRAGNLSGGQQKLLELGRVLMLQPKCIMLDEPTAGVNPSLQNRILSYLGTFSERGITLVIIEHDMKVISDITDTVSVFDQGKIIIEGTFDEVKQDPKVREAYLGSADGSEEGVIL